MKRGLLTVGVVCLVVLAGCTGGAGTSGGDGTNTAATSTSTATSTETPTPTPTPTATPTPTPEPWTAPQQPNTPLENKLSQGNRIDSVETVDGGDSGANVAFALRVDANTSMPDIDPAKYGTVKGEPFFLVYVNGSIDNSSDKVEAGGTLVERSEMLPHEEDGTFTLPVKEGALEEANVDGGEVEITVLLMDEDSEWDDIHGMEQLTVEYETTGDDTSG